MTLFAHFYCIAVSTIYLLTILVSKLKARQAREAEKNERLEAQRKERELKNQQALEVNFWVNC